MVKKAQAGLEYLLTYGWALIMVISLIGVLIFIVSGPSDDVVFSSSDPAKILLKASSFDGTQSKVVLQNVTGGPIDVKSVTPTSNYNSPCLLNGVSFEDETSLSGGSQIELECSLGAGESPLGSVTITYDDFAGLERTVIIRISSSSGESVEGESESIMLSSCGTTLDVEGGEYALSNNINAASGTCITIAADNVILDCQNKVISGLGTGWYGISLNGFDGAEIRNCQVTDFSTAIYVYDSSSNILANNTVSNNRDTGIYFYMSSNNSLTGNTANNNAWYGFNLAFMVNDTNLTGNVAESNGWHGFFLGDSFGTRFIDNVSNSNGWSGITVQSSVGNTFSNNTANSNGTAGSYRYGFSIVSCSDTALNNNTACSNPDADYYCLGSSNSAGSGNTGDTVSGCELSLDYACS